MRRFTDKVDIKNKDDCWNWLGGKSSDGYGNFRFEGKIVGSHVVAYKLHHNVNDLKGLHVLHTCDNPSCVNPEHLFLGTASDNAIDKVSKGRHNDHKGELHPMVKLTEQLVIYIREQFKRGKSQAAIAREVKVTRNNIHHIVHRRSWTHI